MSAAYHARLLRLLPWVGGALMLATWWGDSGVRLGLGGFGLGLLTAKLLAYKQDTL